MFKKLDASFERAARDRAERDALLKRLKRKRKLAVWLLFLTPLLLVAAAFVLASPALISRETLIALNALFPFAGGIFIGSVAATLIIQQDIKMLILCHGGTDDPGVNTDPTA